MNEFSLTFVQMYICFEYLTNTSDFIEENIVPILSQSRIESFARVESFVRIKKLIQKELNKIKAFLKLETMTHEELESLQKKAEIYEGFTLDEFEDFCFHVPFIQIDLLVEEIENFLSFFPQFCGEYNNLFLSER